MNKIERKKEVDKRLIEIEGFNKKVAKVLEGLDVMEGRNVTDTQRKRAVVLRKQSQVQKEKEKLEIELTNL